jgi:hypothetical protein
MWQPYFHNLCYHIIMISAATNCLLVNCCNLNLSTNLNYCYCKSSYSFIAAKKEDNCSATSYLNCFAENYFAL